MFSTVGHNVPRKEGRQKVIGESKYVDDLSFPAMLHGATVRSPAPRGRIRNIEFTGDLPWHEFTIVTAKDIPGSNCVALIVDDQPYLASEFVNHPEEPVVLLAHPDKYLVEKARSAVRIDIEPLPAIFTHRRFARSQGNHLGRGQRLQDISCGEGRCRRSLARSCSHRRGRISDRRAGTALHRNQWRHRHCKSRRRHHHLGIHAMPVLHPQGSAQSVPACARENPRHPDGDRRRFRGQRRISVDDRRPRRAAGVEVRQAGKDDLRSCRGHGRHHQAPSFANAHQDSGFA